MAIFDITYVGDLPYLKTVVTNGGGNAVTAVTASDNVLTVTKGTTFQTDIIKTSSTIAVTNWSNKSQTISVSGVTASNTVVVTPTPTSIDAWVNAGIKCTAQAENSLTLQCNTVPTAAVGVNILIIS